MLATKVIATGVTHLTDARYFAAWEVDLLAFPLGPAGVDWLTLNAMREWVAGPEIAVELNLGADAGGQTVSPALYRGAMLEELVRHGITSVIAPATDIASLSAEVREAYTDAGIKRYAHLPVAGYQSVDDLRESLEELPPVTGVILDFESGGITWADLAEGHPFGVEDLRALLAARPVYLQIALGKIDPKGVAAAYSPAGFAVRGSSEEKVGYKSFDDLDPLFEGLEVFD